MAGGGETTMEGMLEKQSTGVSRFLGKTSYWCTLAGSCLQYCKENKRSSVVDTLLLGDAQMVRKTNNDRLGTQFEIVMKKGKTHVFTANSAEDCRTWVRHLQQAMIHKGPNVYPETRAPTNNGGYEDVVLSSDLKPTVKSTTSVTNRSTGEYAEVWDAIRLPPGVVNPRQEVTSNQYAEVADAIRYEGPTKVAQNDDVKAGNSNQSVRSLIDKANGYSTLDELSVTRRESTQSQVHKSENIISQETSAPVYARVNKNRGNVTNEENSHSTINLPDTVYTEKATDNISDVSDNVEAVREGEHIENLDRELKRLDTFPVPPVWDSFTADDTKPLDDLKDFLSNNPILSRPSYSKTYSEQDPMEEMKKLIQENM